MSDKAIEVILLQLIQEMAEINEILDRIIENSL